MDPRDSALRAHQRRQHGLFTLRQALDAGFTRPAIRRRLVHGRWSEADTRVYRIADGTALDDRGRVHARTLAVGGVASGLTAGALFGFVPFPRDVHVTVARAYRRRGGASASSSRALPVVDITSLAGIPVTTPVRTLIDLAGQLTVERFEPILDTAIFDGTVRMDRLEARAGVLQHPRRRGCAVVLRLLSERHPDLVRVRSLLEAHALRACARSGLPHPIVNHRVGVGGGVRVLDLAWPDVKVAVEVDGFAPHTSTRRTFDDDKVRGNDLLDEEWAVYHLTATALTHDAAAAFAQVAAAVERRWVAISRAGRAGREPVDGLPDGWSLSRPRSVAARQPVMGTEIAR